MLDSRTFPLSGLFQSMTTYQIHGNYFQLYNSFQTSPLNATCPRTCTCTPTSPPECLKMPINPSWVLVTPPSKNCYQAFSTLQVTHHCLSRVGIILVSAIPLPQESTSKALARLKRFLFQNTVYLRSTTTPHLHSTTQVQATTTSCLDHRKSPHWLPCVFFPAAIKIHSTHTT